MAELLRSRGELITGGQLTALCSFRNRNDGPSILFDLYYARLVTTDVLRASIAEIWNDAELPEESVPRPVWFRWFRAVGFTVDGIAAARPTEPIRLYRGCANNSVRRMSWTTSQTLAQWFADRHKQDGRQGSVFVADVAPGPLLAEITGNSEFFRDNDPEMIIDPTGIKLRSVGK